MSFSIGSITLREITLPLKEPFRISSGVVDVRQILLVEMTDTDGVSVWSECVAGEQPNYSPETIATSWLAIKEWVAPRVVGREFQRPDDVSAVLSHDFRGHNMAKAAVEMGSWALVAERGGQCLSEALGGTRTQIKRSHENRQPADIVAALSLAIFASFVGFAISGTFVSVLYYPHFWYLIGFAVVIKNYAVDVADTRIGHEK